MALHNSVVLDLTSLETDSLLAAGPAIAFVRSCLARGRRVIAVVNASPDRAARDLVAANRLGPTADPRSRAGVLASGVVDAADAFAGLLRDAGINAAAASPGLWPTTRGHTLDAEPRRVSGAGFDLALSRHAVVVLPGGVGRDEDGATTSLGADTSTLSALFLGDRLALPVDRAVGTAPVARHRDRGAATVGARKAERMIERTGVRVSSVPMRPALGATG